MESFKPNDNFIYYLYWIVERQNIFFKRLNGEPAPYTEDEILNNHKFTNVYRVLDRSSQYLVKNVIKNEEEFSAEDMFWRILLYKHFNIPSTWEYLESVFGRIDLSISFEDIALALTDYQEKGNKLYSNAYMMTAFFMKKEEIKKKYGITTGSKKHEAYLQIFKKSFIEDGLIDKIIHAKNLEQAFELIRSVIAVGDFIAYQYVQDWNYTGFVNWDDNSFCAAGAGTRRGIERTFDIIGKPDYQVIVKWVHENFNDLLLSYSKKFNLPLDLKSLPNHLPTVPDLSNCFCETDKYMRGLGIEQDGISGKRIKQIFTENKSQIKYEFPKKWGVKI